MKHRRDDLSSIRKARFASFVLLLACFAAMFVILAVAGERLFAYAASGAVLAALLALWWVWHRRILFGEAAFFEALAQDMRSVHHRLRMVESAVRQIGDGVVIVADDGDFVLVNETAKTLLGAWVGDLDGARYDEYAAGFSEKLERARILEAAREGRFSETVAVDGQVYRLVIFALVPEEGRGRGAVAVFSDVTESTKVERMQTDFVANVSHELKTPLASVKSYAETLMEGAVEDAETVREFLGIIVSEADRMDRLVKGLMYLARVDAAASPPETAESDLASLARAAVKKLDMLAREKSLAVNLMFPETLRVAVEMDRDRIEQVALNVLGNAIKYTEERGRVDVDVIAGGEFAQIVVTDNGVGIPETALPRVFERFFRVDKARSGKMGGTGLGLAISKQIVDAHGGTITVESKLGRGTTVTVGLPMGRVRGVAGIE